MTSLKLFRHWNLSFVQQYCQQLRQKLQWLSLFTIPGAFYPTKTHVMVLKNSQIISFIEAWLSRYAYLPTSLLPNFKPIYKLRSESSHSQNILYTSLANADRGGVAIFVQNDLQCTERVYDTQNLEYVAILIEKSIVCILVNIYRLPIYSSPAFCKILDNLLQEIDLKENLLPIIVTGDFNENIFQKPYPILQLFQKYHFTQLVHDMTTASDSCLDLVFVMNFLRNPTCKIFPIYYSFHEFVRIYFVSKTYFQVWMILHHSYMLLFPCDNFYRQQWLLVHMFWMSVITWDELLSFIFGISSSVYIFNSCHLLKLNNTYV